MLKRFDFVDRYAPHLLFFVTALVLVPFIVLSFFNHPASDDYCYTNFIQNHPFWEAQIKHYLIWTGRYTATFLLTVDPINPHDLSAYRVLPVLFLLLLGISIFLLIKSLLPGLSRINQLVISFLIFFLYLYYAPNMAEAFYWRAGSITYQLASILSLLLFVTVRELQKCKSVLTCSIFTVLACLLTVVTAGLNETSMIINLVVISLWTTGWLAFKKGKRVEMVLVFLFTLAATIVVVMAPGNAVRMAEKPDKFQFLFSLVGAIKMTLMSILRWTPMTVLLIVLFSPVLNKAAKSFRAQHRFQNMHLWHLLLSVIFFFAFLVLCFFPSFWSQGGRPPFRTVNVIYLLFIFGSFFLTCLFLIFLQEKRSPVPMLPKEIAIALVTVALGLIIFKPNNLGEAYADLFYGTAYQYHLEMEARYRLLENCSRKTCTLPALKNEPKTILSSDLSKDPSHESYYYNECIAWFFNISEVMVQETEKNRESDGSDSL